MDERAMQRSSQNTLTTSENPLKRVLAMKIINKIRILQGWNMISPKDAEPIAAVWVEQLDRAGIPVEEYDSLYNKVVDWRVKCLQHDRPMPNLTVETFIAARKRAI